MAFDQPGANVSAQPTAAQRALLHRRPVVRRATASEDLVAVAQVPVVRVAEHARRCRARRPSELALRSREVEVHRASVHERVVRAERREPERGSSPSSSRRPGAIGTETTRLPVPAWSTRPSRVSRIVPNRSAPTLYVAGPGRAAVRMHASARSSRVHELVQVVPVARGPGCSFPGGPTRRGSA